MLSPHVPNVDDSIIQEARVRAYAALTAPALNSSDLQESDSHSTRTRSLPFRE